MAGWPRAIWPLVALCVVLPPEIVWGSGQGVVISLLVMMVLAVVLPRHLRRMVLTSSERRQVMAAMLTATATGDPRLDDWIEYIALKQAERPRSNRITLGVVGLLVVAVPVVSAVVGHNPWLLLFLALAPLAWFPVTSVFAVQPDAVVAAMEARDRSEPVE